jgi:tetratricopeptide (TPR) repeat protein
MGLLLTAAVASGAASARADDAAQAAADPAQEARQQYQAGMQAYQAKRFVEAALHFEAAVIQRPHAVALYTAALAWEQANRPERAADDFVRSLEVAGSSALSASQAQNARDRLASLEKAMGTLEVVAPDGWHVQLDANTGVSVPAHLHAMPGVHSLMVQAPSAPIQHRDVTLELGKTTHLELAAGPSEATPPPPTPKEPSIPVEPAPAAPTRDIFDLRRALGFGVVGAGVASVAAGAILGVNALSARDAYNAGPTQAAYNHASSLQTWTDVAFVAGGLFLVGGAALVLWPSPKAGKPAEESALSIAPTVGGAVLSGSF